MPQHKYNTERHLPGKENVSFNKSTRIGGYSVDEDMPVEGKLKPTSDGSRVKGLHEFVRPWNTEVIDR